MRKATVVVVAAMILLAGCSGGGGGAASPGEESTTTLVNNTSEGDIQSDSTSPLASTATNSQLDNSTEVDMTLYNGSDQSDVLIRNDTANSREFVQLNSQSQSGSVYTTEDYVAARNGTTGEVEYGEPDSFVGSELEFAADLGALSGLFYIGTVEWEESGTTTVDGEEAIVYESDSLNETVLSQNEGSGTGFGFEQSEVQSVNGEFVVGQDGQVHSITVEIETPEGTYGIDMAFEYDDITVEKPDWVDESEAP